MAKRGTTAGIDLAELERLCMMQCTDEEIAAWFGVTSRTIERRRQNPKFAEVMERGKAKGRISVRRQQLKLLEAGNATMGVWLGKQILGQSDHMRHQIQGQAANLMVIIPRAIDLHANPGKSIESGEPPTVTTKGEANGLPEGNSVRRIP
jgi:hypothetical protein